MTHVDCIVGSAPDAEDVAGTITIPEVAHDTEEDEFVVCQLYSPHDEAPRFSQPLEHKLMV